MRAAIAADAYRDNKAPIASANQQLWL